MNEAKTYFALSLSVLLWSGLPGQVSAREPERQIMGIYLNMTREEALKRLEEVGDLERKERKRQEIWRVRDRSFSHLIVGFDAEEKLRYVTAVTREDKEAQRLPYDAIGDLKQARQAGDPKIKNFNFEWSLPAKDGGAGLLVIARGRDPEFAATLSLKRVEL